MLKNNINLENKYIKVINKQKEKIQELNADNEINTHYKEQTEKDIKRYKNIKSDSENIIKDLQEELKQKDSFNKDNIIKEIEELKEYKKI